MNIRCFIPAVVALAMVALAAGAPLPGSAPTEFKSLKDVVAVLPHPLVQELKTPVKMEAARQQANEIFTQKAINKTLTMKVHVADWHDAKGPDNIAKVAIWMTPLPMNVLGTSFTVRMWISVRKDQAGALSKISKGGELTATGKLTRFGFSATGGNLILDGDLSEAKIDAH